MVTPPSRENGLPPIAAADSGVQSQAASEAGLHDLILRSLDDDKAVDVISIPLKGKSSIADVMVIASGNSSRHVAALADHLMERMKAELGIVSRVEGLPQADWVLIDAGDVVVHLFRPEVRSFYNLEKMWSVEVPAGPAAA